MKKIFTLLAAAVMGLSASAATLYFENTGNWSTVNMYSWNNNGDMSWPGQNITANQTATKDGHTYIVCETPYNLVIFNNGSGTQTSNLDVVDNGIYNASGFTKTTFDGGSVEVKDVVSLAGEFNGYNGADSNRMFTDNGNGTWTYKWEGEFASNFKVVYNNNWYGTRTPVQPGVEYTLSDIAFDNSNLAQSPVQNPVFTFTPESKTLVVTWDGGQKVFPETMTIIGNVNGWTEDWVANNQIVLTNEGDGIFKGEKVEISESKASGFGYFSFATNKVETDNWGGLGTRYGATVNDYVVEFDTEMTIQAGENAFKVEAGTYNFTLNFDEMTLVIEKVETEVVYPETPSNEELVAAVSVPTGFNVRAEESAYYDGVVITGNTTDETVTFTFTAPEGYDTVYIAVTPGDAGVNPLHKIGYGADWQPASYATAMGAVKTDKVSVDADGEDHDFYVFYGLGDKINMDFITYTANITKKAVGVEMVAAEADATYFNLQGARVANPVNGIFVKVVNGKAAKVVK